jgi:hypothetical protein
MSRQDNLPAETLASRRPAHPVGWLLLALGLLESSNGLAEGYARYGLVARPGALPAASFVARLLVLTFLAMLACVSFILLLTPTGSLPSPRWRWWARVTAAGPAVAGLSWLLGPGVLDPPYPPLASPLAVHALAGPIKVANAVAMIVTIVAVVVAAGSLVLRYRRARGTERQQLRWVALAAALAPLAPLVVVAAQGRESVFVWTLGVYLALLPLPISAAILRYRLYDLDRIISRTLAYGLLTVLLGGAYAGVVLGLGQRLGQDSPLVVATATLALATAFQPARRRVQNLVDQRFNRRRYAPPAPSRRSLHDSESRSTWMPYRPSWLAWSSRPCSPLACRCGYDLPSVRPPTSAARAHPALRHSRRELPRPFAELCETACFTNPGGTADVATQLVTISGRSPTILSIAAGRRRTKPYERLDCGPSNHAARASL